MKLSKAVINTLDINSSAALPSVIGMRVASTLIISGESVVVTPDDAKPGMMACIIRSTSDQFMMDEYIKHARKEQQEVWDKQKKAREDKENHII